MSFWDHVDDLRRVILRSVGAIILLSVVFFTLMPRIFDSIILAPCHSDFILYRLLCDLSQHTSILPDFCNDHFEVKLINIQLASQFFIHVHVDCLVVCVSICHLSTVDFRQSGIIRRRKTTCQRGISRRKYHVLYRYRSGIFSCISVNVAFFGRVPSERNGS